MDQIKINYNELMKKEIAGLINKPRLLLHACCGPCSTYPVTLLNEYFNIDIAYFNPNIYPYEEWKKRLDNLNRFIDLFNKENNSNIKVHVLPYNHNVYLKTCGDYKEDKEGGRRCSFCHELRLRLSYEFASINNYDYFTTVMTVSSHKPSTLINEIGLNLEKEYPNTKYLLSDFKKENGQLKGILIAKKYNLYRQNFCGCEFAPHLEKKILKA